MRWLLLSALCLAGCIVDSASLEISRSELEETTRDSIHRLEVFVLPDWLSDRSVQIGCPALLDGSLSTDDARLEPHYAESFLLTEVGPPIGRLKPGRVVFFVRARDESCTVVAMGCREVEISSGEGKTFEVALLAPAEPIACPDSLACVDGDCRPCVDSEECDDGSLCTVDFCDDGTCSANIVFPDADRDDFGSGECGGPDCDDGDPDVYPGAPRRCGRAVDHDCDGVVDDAQGCDPCPNATGLVHRSSATISTAAVGIYVVGSPPSESSPHELFVVTPSAIEVYEVPPTGAAALVGSSEYPGVGPLPPAVLGDHTVIAEFGTLGAWVFATDDLRAGSAVPLTNVGTSLGTISAFKASRRHAYFNVIRGSRGELAAVATDSLPSLEEPEVVLPSGEWQNSTSFALEVGEEGGWLYGVLGQTVTFARLDADGTPRAGGSAAIVDGFGWSVALAPETVFLAQGDKGLMAVNRRRVESVLDGERCCNAADYTLYELPPGCSDALCENAITATLAGATRALVMTFTNRGAQASRLYLLDITDPTAMTAIDVGPEEDWGLPLSNGDASPRGLWVSGNTVYAAARVEGESTGVIDVFDLVCE